MRCTVTNHTCKALSRKSSPSISGLYDIVVLVLAVYVYFFVRGLVDARESDAMDNAHTIVSFEKSLGIFHEQQLQSTILDHQWAVSIANGIYMYGHWPVIVGTLAWLFIRHRSMFRIFRSAMILSGLVGFAFFFFLPTAPPRLVEGLGLVDTVTLYSEAYRVLQPPSLTNPYAAMPSLHVGWNLLMGVAIIQASGNRIWRVIGITMPLVMYVATILTGNHYFVDGIMGSALALAALAIVTWWKQRPQAPRMTTPDTLSEMPLAGSPPTSEARNVDAG